FGVCLYENSPIFDFTYSDIMSNPQIAQGGYATVGLQKATGSSFLQYSVNSPIITNHLKLIFSPAPVGTCTPTPTPTCHPGDPTNPCPTDTPTGTPTPCVDAMGLPCTPTPTPTCDPNGPVPCAPTYTPTPTPCSPAPCAPTYTPTDTPTPCVDANGL